MASDVREYLRAAQAAEIRGDTGRAMELLRSAAAAYQRAGNHPRAEQMLRHAQRLEAHPSAAPRAVDPELTQRGPTLADPAQAAWCSFCCRPRDEVGPLVAGPAGAFICTACASQASSLLAARASSSRSADTGDGAAVQPPVQLGGEGMAPLRAALAAAAGALSDVATRLAAVGLTDGGHPAKALVDGLSNDARGQAKNAAPSRSSMRRKRRR
jgi:hypothetical protein